MHYGVSLQWGPNVLMYNTKDFPTGLRSLVYLGRSADLLDAALAEHRDAVAHRQGFFLVVRDVDERDAHLALHLLQLELHLLAELEVERAEWLVEQQHLGLVDDGPGQRHALSLAAGELGRLPAAEPGQPDHLQCPADLLAPLGLGHVPHAQAELNVLDHRHVREQRVVLEHGVDVPGVWRHLRDVVAAKLDPPAVRRLEPCNQPQQGGLPRPGRAKQGEELTGPPTRSTSASATTSPYRLRRSATWMQRPYHLQRRAARGPEP